MLKNSGHSPLFEEPERATGKLSDEGLAEAAGRADAH
jgi:hypothetical protein